MIVPGVLNGSNGPILYEEKDIKASVDAWNGMPITVYHPKTPISARSQEILNSQGVGIVLNARMDGNTLRAEGWFDIEVLARIDPRVHNALLNNQKIELSTGLGMDEESVQEGTTTTNGELYKSIARNYRPDHLAVLPDQVGACSVDQGCGVLNKKESVPDVTSTHSPTGEVKVFDKDKVVEGLITNCACWTEADKEVLNSMSEEQLTRLATEASKEINTRTTLNSITSGSTVEVDGEKMVFNTTTNLFEKKAKDKKKMDDESEEENEEKDKKGKKGKAMNEAGQGMGEVPQTKEQWFAAAPPEVQNTLRYAEQIQNAHKTGLVTKIVNAAPDVQREALKPVYNAMSIEQLEVIAGAIVEAPAEETPVNNYLAQFSPPVNTNNSSAPKEEPLAIPEMDWSN